MDWYDVTGKYHEKTFAHDGCLSSLPEIWQRDPAATWRLEADMNNGGYIQFLANWGRESYEYGSRGLRRIGASAMANIVDRCQALIDEHCDTKGRSQLELQRLISSHRIGIDGCVTKEQGSELPEIVTERIMALSYEFMDYPDDIAALGLAYFGNQLKTEKAAGQTDEPNPE